MRKNLFLSAYVAFILIAIVFTLTSLRKETKTNINASKATTLSLSNAGNVNTGQPISINVSLDPGTNQVSFVKLAIGYDSSKITPDSNGFVAGNIPGTNPPVQFFTIDGPVYNNCSMTQCTMSISLSVGSNFTQAIKTQTKLATLNFQAIAPTDSNGTPITIDNSTQVYSVGPSDSANENVLLSANPTKVVISGQSITPSPTINPSITPSSNSVIISNMQFSPQQITVSQGTTVTWTNQETTVSHTTTSDNQSSETWDSGTLSPGQSFSHTFNTPGTYTYHCNIHPMMTGSITVQANTSTTPNPSAPVSGQTTGSISVYFEAIDANNTLNPKHPQRKIILQFFTSNNFSSSPLTTITDYVSHIVDDTNGTFSDQTADLSTVSSGTYYVLVKSPEGSLREQLNPQKTTIIAGKNNILNGSTDGSANATIPTLRMGDLNNDNAVDIKDYNILVDCYGGKQSSTSCAGHHISDSTKGMFADLNDDNLVNGIDYNILVRHFGENGY